MLSHAEELKADIDPISSQDSEISLTISTESKQMIQIKSSFNSQGSGAHTLAVNI
jgi:hypothetical protein